MTIYIVGARRVRPDDGDFQRIMSDLYAQKARPHCGCRVPGIEMQLAKINGQIFVKRMPNTGSDHAAGCDSYEPPHELSGLGQVMGSAIQENVEAGTTALKFDFAMTKTGNRAAPVAGDGQTDTVKSDGAKLSLRGMLHYLWDEAGFSKWSPNMAGKRSWYVIRKYLLHAAENKLAKGADLASNLYIPESFSLQEKDAIAQRRIAQMMKVSSPGGGSRRLMILIAEVNKIEPARYGYKIIPKHSNDYHFMLDEDLYKRMQKRFAAELALWTAYETSHLVVVGTFGVSAAGIATIEECALMCTTENWIPYEHIFDIELLESLSAKNRRFVKGLRYNLAAGRPLASVVLTDTAEPTAMYIVPPNATDAYQAALDELLATSKLASWVWTAGVSVMPPMPAAS